MTHVQNPLCFSRGELQTDGRDNYRLSEYDYGSEWNGEIIDLDDLLNAMDDSENWDDIDTSWWRKACEMLGIDYDDPTFNDGQDILDTLHQLWNKEKDGD